MTQEQRDELMQLSAQAFGTPELMQSLSQLDSNLQALRPGEDWRGSERFDGEQPLGLGDGTGVLQDLADLDELSEQLSQSYRRRADGRHRPRHALAPARRRGGRFGAHPARTGEDAARERHAAPGFGRDAQAHSEGDAPARQVAAEGHRDAHVGRGRDSASCTRPARRGRAPGRRGRGSSAPPSRGTSRAPS